MRGTRYFSNELFAFIKELKANNDKPWFEENKPRYEEHIKRAATRFIEDFGPHLEKISPHFVADPRGNGGSLFRIYRDTRFSKDKTPYKTHVGIRFQHERAKNVHAPGYYLHIATDGVWVGAGIWHPESDALKKIRGAILDDPTAWKRAKNAKRFRERYELTGDSLKRAPKGVDPEHPLIEDLRRKDFIGVAKMTKKTLLGPELMRTFTAMCKDAASLNRFLCRALDLRY
ncbi:MAG: DUF2461 domain-containing protein [Gemmatimonadetes bacterium]|nr:DUF2461 domain-containing protein [Gemmatimonadota bacterium]